MNQFMLDLQVYIVRRTVNKRYHDVTPVDHGCEEQIPVASANWRVKGWWIVFVKLGASALNTVGNRQLLGTCTVSSWQATSL